MSTHLRSTTARRRAELVSEGVTASYIHEITRPVRRAGAVRQAPVRLRPGARPRRALVPARAAA